VLRPEADPPLATMASSRGRAACALAAGTASSFATYYQPFAAWWTSGGEKGKGRSCRWSLLPAPRGWADNLVARCEGGAGGYADDSQAGGHVDGVRFEGTMLRKRLQDQGRGDREVAALAALARSARWQRFVPQFGGTVTDAEEEGQAWLVMENLVANMERPCVLDLKVGTRHYSPDAPPKKVAKELHKAASTTIATHGLRIVGCRIPHSDPLASSSAGAGWREVWGYKLGRDATADVLPAVLHRFLGTSRRRRSALAFALDLQATLQAQREHVFYGSSLLLAFDAAAGPAAPLRIKMIDFGHVHAWSPAEDGQQGSQAGIGQPHQPPVAALAGLASDGYLFGLGTFIEILGDEALAVSEGAGSAAWGASGRWTFNEVLA
jgi:hypothetical protein